MISSTKLAPGNTNNFFLDSLPPTSAAAIVPRFEQLSGPLGLEVAAAGMSTENIVFPIGGVVSSVNTMRDGSQVEVAMVGREGFFGVHVALGDSTSTTDAVVQIPGSLLRMSRAEFVRCLNDDAALLRTALRYAQVTFATLAQLSACNRLHSLNERCARWLLMVHDRVEGNEFLLTHEYLATMLGVRRPGVSVAANALERAGLIAYRRGHVVIRDRAGLEAVACECYVDTNAEALRLLGYDVRKSQPGHKSQPGRVARSAGSPA